MEAFGKQLKNGEGKTMDEALAGVTYPPCHNITTAERDWWASACRVLYNENKELADPQNGHATCGGECCEEAIDKIASLKYENQKLKKGILDEHTRAERCKDRLIDLADISKGLQKDCLKLKAEKEDLENMLGESYSKHDVFDLEEKLMAEMFEKEQYMGQNHLLKANNKKLKEVVKELGVQHTGTGANETQWWHQICKDM